ncbi:hypothetical protein N7456_011166 [Penicillium angulare]|uniref:Alpha-galactosidase A n=1 Tax=Penicillium angulare TaxID=116970 RepID=A0A9W9ETH4_9EURO|nr:hypothetical protein N7456_011166 [Penicillium angulare]
MSSESFPAMVLSMDVSIMDDSDYRILIGNQIKYLTIRMGTFDPSTLSMPLSSLPEFAQDNNTWNLGDISRDPASGQVIMKLEQKAFKGITDQWHPVSIDCLDLKRTELLTPTAYEVVYSGNNSSFPTELPLIAKIARFEWEIPRLAQETSAYQRLENTGLAPRFLGHIHEHERIIGFLLEKVEGRHADINDLKSCEASLRRLHEIGIIHGDPNRYNFIIQDNTARLIDFENSRVSHDTKAMEDETELLREQLLEETGRGAGFARGY